MTIDIISNQSSVIHDCRDVLHFVSRANKNWEGLNHNFKDEDKTFKVNDKEKDWTHKNRAKNLKLVIKVSKERTKISITKALNSRFRLRNTVIHDFAPCWRAFDMHKRSLRGGGLSPPNVGAPAL